MELRKFEEWARKVPARVGEVGPVREEKEGFAVQVLLEKEPNRLKIGAYFIPKQTWDSWWEKESSRFDGSSKSSSSSSSRRGGRPGG